MNSAETCTAVIKCNCLGFHAHTRGFAAEFQRTGCLPAMGPPAPGAQPRPMLARSAGWISVRAPGAGARGTAALSHQGVRARAADLGQAGSSALRALSRDSFFQMPLDFF